MVDIEDNTLMSGCTRWCILKMAS